MEVYIYSKGLYIRWALRCRAVDNGGHWICWSVALLIGLGPTACKKEGKKTWLALVFFWMVAAILTAHWMFFFFNPTFWYIQYYFLLYLISSGGRKRVRGREREKGRPHVWYVSLRARHHKWSSMLLLAGKPPFVKWHRRTRRPLLWICPSGRAHIYMVGYMGSFRCDVVVLLKMANRFTPGRNGTHCKNIILRYCERESSFSLCVRDMCPSTEIPKRSSLIPAKDSNEGGGGCFFPSILDGGKGAWWAVCCCGNKTGNNWPITKLLATPCQRLSGEKSSLGTPKLLGLFFFFIIN